MQFGPAMDYVLTLNGTGFARVPSMASRSAPIPLTGLGNPYPRVSELPSLAQLAFHRKPPKPWTPCTPTHMTQHTSSACTARRTRLTLEECNHLLPLVRSIANELVERREEFKDLRSRSKELEGAQSPEGLSVALSDLDARILELEDCILEACEELARQGLTVHQMNPLVVHFPGRTGAEDAQFSWTEGDPFVSDPHEQDRETEDAGCFIHSGFGFAPEPSEEEAAPAESPRDA